MSVDRYLDRIYSERDYRCLHFVRDVWGDLTGKDIGPALAGILESRSPSEAPRKTMWADFKRLQRPADPCLVLMLDPPGRAHAAVYIRGRCLHLTGLGVTHIPLHIASLGFKTVRFYQ